MSRFYGDLTGQAKTTATRRGSAKSGIRSHVRGWDVGVKVFANDKGGKDEIQIYVTTGSNNTGSDILIAEFKDGEWINQ